MAKLKYDDVVFIKKCFLTKQLTDKELSLKFNVGYTAIQNIRHNYTWKHLQV